MAGLFCLCDFSRSVHIQFINAAYIVLIQFREEGLRTMANDKTKVGPVLAGLLLGMLLGALDQTIMATAMPTVIQQLGGLSLYSWVFSVYMLASTTSMPIFGKLADLYGRKKMYMIGMGLFVGGSALCGLAANMTELIVFRGIQGIGAGALMPLAITIIADMMPPEKRANMQGMFGVVFALTSIVGPAVGGFIVDHFSWNWIFYVNLPIGLAAMAIIAAALKESRSPGKRSIDWPGAALLSGSIVSVMLALVFGGGAGENAASYGWGSPFVIGLFAVGAALLGLFLWAETKAKEPILPLSLFRNRVVAVSFATGFMMNAAMFGAITYIPLYVQGIVGVSASLAGYILTPLMLAVVAASIVSGRLLAKVQYRVLIACGLAVMAIGFYLMSTMDVHTTKTTIVLYMIVAGLGMGPLMPAINTAAQEAADRKQRGVVTSSVQFFRSVGGTIGVSVLGAIMSDRLHHGLSALAGKFPQIPAEQLGQLSNPRVLVDKTAMAALPREMAAELQQLFANAITQLFAVGAAIVILGFLISFLMGNAKLNVREDAGAKGKPGEAKGEAGAEAEAQRALQPEVV
ncbi:MDR family MFS transporter [Paenibacillus sp. GYB003]|uniref:MDR family MFS transporter n=1 Tax=Paenibacillus sp. GYB003 TaxID=2994392 RepID=UPI002F964462